MSSQNWRNILFINNIVLIYGQFILKLQLHLTVFGKKKFIHFKILGAIDNTLAIATHFARLKKRIL